MKNLKSQFRMVGALLLWSAVLTACTTTPTSTADRKQMEKNERIANRIDGRVGT